jgi:hypothetical protein
MDDRWLFIAFCAAFIVIGVVIVIVGKLLEVQPGSRLRSWSVRNAYEAILSRWGLVDTHTEDEQRNTLITLTQQITAQNTFGMGLGILCGGLLALGFALALTFQDSILSNQPTVSLFVICVACLALGISAGGVAGHIKGMHEFMRREPAPPTVTARPYRRVTDYISPVIVVWVFAAYALAAEIYLAVAAQSLGLDAIWFGWEHVHWSGVTLGVVWMVSSLLPPFGSFLCAIWVTHAPNPAIGEDDALTARLGDMLRARAMTLAWQASLMMMGFSILIAFLAIPYDIQTGPLETAWGIVPIAMMVSYIGSMFLLAIGSQSAQLGGRINGWPWRRPARQERTAVEGG